MRTFKGNSRKTVDGVYSSETFVPPKHHPPVLLQRMSRREKGRPIQRRVKPGPSPARKSETEWMTEAEIEQASLDPSEFWIASGSGNVGRVHLEVLCCDGLSNLARALGDKSDPFACLVYEDCIVNTDVINDCLSPRWMPWSQRAFVFNMKHPCSQIFIGVFDFNQGFPEPTHDPLGRTVVNITNCRQGSVYTMKHDLFDSGDMDRKPLGTITIRVRIEIKNERRALVSEIGFKDHYTVATVKRPDFKCANYALANDVSSVVVPNV
jgi:C2 domain